MKLSQEAKELADNYYFKKAEDIERVLGLKLSAGKYKQFTGQGNYINLSLDYIVAAEDKAKARIETYLDAFRYEGITPNETDISEISWELEEIIKKGFKQCCNQKFCSGEPK